MDTKIVLTPQNLLTVNFALIFNVVHISTTTQGEVRNATQVDYICVEYSIQSHNMVVLTVYR